MTICYRCQEPIQDATTVAGPRGERHYYNCAEKAVAPVAPPPEPKVITKYVTLDPVVVTKVIAILDKRKAALYAAAGALLGGTIGVVARTFM